MKKVIVRRNEYLVVEDEKLMEIVRNNNIIGNIYVGKVKDVKKAVRASFINIEEDKLAYLEIGSDNKLMPGDDVLIEVKKNKSAEKSYFSTANVSFNGYNFILTKNKKIHLSNKITDKKERERILNYLSKYKEKEYGFVVRAKAVYKEDIEYDMEIEFLEKKFKNIVKRADGIIKDKKIYSNDNILYKAICENRNVDEFIFETDKQLEEANKYKDIFTIKASFKVADIKSYKDQIKDIGKKYIWLKSGGKIILDKTEAMNIIDVDTGKNISSKNKEKNIVKTNKEAAIEIARQVRLRDLSGIILIDFINMKNKEHRDEIKNILNEQFKKDSKKVVLFTFTKLGIFEMTREIK